MREGEALSARLEGKVETLGDVADILRAMKSQGVTLGSLGYAIGRVYHEEEEPLAVRSSLNLGTPLEDDEPVQRCKVWGDGSCGCEYGCAEERD